MPYSMTGFAYNLKQYKNYEISAKIKSLNHRGIDIKIKGSKDITILLDLEIRNIVRKYVERGSIDIYIDVKQTDIEFPIDIQKLKKAVDTIKNIQKSMDIELSGDKTFELASNLVSEKKEDIIDESLKKEILSVVKQTVKELQKEREKEGKKLVKDIKQRLKLIENLLKKVEKQKDKLIATAKEKIMIKIKELFGEEHSERAYIEATLLADKMDITEEIVRLKSHIKRFKELLKSKEPVGRKMDFLCQEMLREINTMGNKMPDLSPYTVEMKTELEKIRQQVQNIE
ncbi:MAG: YicC family protein [Aquificae bacterium]|nr:YicC family protein [Aquificota bacterium]